MIFGYLILLLVGGYQSIQSIISISLIRSMVILYVCITIRHIDRISQARNKSMIFIFIKERLKILSRRNSRSSRTSRLPTNSPRMISYLIITIITIPILIVILILIIMN